MLRSATARGFASLSRRRDLVRVRAPRGAISPRNSVTPDREISKGKGRGSAPSAMDIDSRQRDHTTGGDEEVSDQEVPGHNEDNNMDDSVPEELPLCDYEVAPEPTPMPASEHDDAVMGIDTPTVEA